jgi:O-antigen/teichoic acid export membrane protein
VVVFPIYRGRTGALAAVSGGAFVANAVLNYLTVPRYGPPAAAISTIACYVLLFWLTWRLFAADEPALPWRRLALEAAAAAPLFAAAAWLHA